MFALDGNGDVHCACTCIKCTKLTRPPLPRIRIVTRLSIHTLLAPHYKTHTLPFWLMSLYRSACCMAVRCCQWMNILFTWTLYSFIFRFMFMITWTHKTHYIYKCSELCDMRIWSGMRGLELAFHCACVSTNSKRALRFTVYFGQSSPCVYYS